MTLSRKQQIFSFMLGKFLVWINENPGYMVSIGEAYRPPFVAEYYAKQGKGVERSYHTNKLAIDLNLFINGVYQPTTEAHRILGNHWKAMDPNCVWGGDFKRKDGNHYSMWEGK